MGRYLKIWNWIAICAVFASPLFGGRLSPSGLLMGLAPFVFALLSASLVRAPLFALLVRLGSGLFALLAAGVVLRYGVVTPRTVRALLLFSAVPMLNAIYLVPCPPELPTLRPHRSPLPPRSAPSQDPDRPAP